MLKRRLVRQVSVDEKDYDVTEDYSVKHNVRVVHLCKPLGNLSSTKRKTSQGG